MQLGLGMDEITRDRTFYDLGADSLDLAEIWMACEEEFETPISDEDADRLTNVGKAIDYLTERNK